MQIRFIILILVAAMLTLAPISGRGAVDEDLQDLSPIMEENRDAQGDEQTVGLPTPKESNEDQSPPDSIETAEPAEMSVQFLKAEKMEKYEAAGSYTTIIGGSLGKALWRGQSRDDITPLLKSLQPRHKFPGMSDFEKRLLLTAADMKEVTGPEDIPMGEDFLTIRLEKLIENGWYDEAYKLYTDSIVDPPHERLAELGILLILYNGDLPTACLEEKVIGADFMHTSFFKTLDGACKIELGISEDLSPLSQSETLTSVFTDEAFFIPALDTRRLLALSPLERGLIFAKGRVRYDVNLITPEIISDIPSRLLMLYRRDKTLPEELKTPLLREALARDLISREVFRKQSTPYQNITKIEDDKLKETALLEKLSTELSIPVLAAYTPLLTVIEPENPSESLIHKVVAAFMYAGKDIPDFWKASFEELAGENIKNYVYLQIVSALYGEKPNLEKSQLLSEEDIISALPRDFGQVIAIFESLDLKKMLDEEMLIVYEKQSSLTEASNYGMQLDSLEKDIKTSAEKEHSGLTVLNVLKALDGRLTETPPSLISVSLSSLKNVGYIDDVRSIGKKAAAEIIINNEGE